MLWYMYYSNQHTSFHTERTPFHLDRDAFTHQYYEERHVANLAQYLASWRTCDSKSAALQREMEDRTRPSFHLASKGVVEMRLLKNRSCFPSLLSKLLIARADFLGLDLPGRNCTLSSAGYSLRSAR